MVSQLDCEELLNEIILGALKFEKVKEKLLTDIVSRRPFFSFRYRTSALDVDIVGMMAKYFGVSRQAEAERLLRWSYETHTATYLILLNRHFSLLNVQKSILFARLFVL